MVSGLVLTGCPNRDNRVAETSPLTNAPEVVTPADAGRPADRGPDAAPAAPDRYGNFKVRGDLPPRHPCQNDWDCSVTQYHPGGCCPHPCHTEDQPGSRAWVKAVEDLRQEVCSGRRIWQDYDCDQARCTHRITYGVCRDGSCALEQGEDPDRFGAYRFEAHLPPRSPCESDGDCRLTSHSPGRCCPAPCPRDLAAGTTAWVEQAEELHRRFCGPISDNNCAIASCPNEGLAHAVCRDGACRAVLVP